MYAQLPRAAEVVVVGGGTSGCVVAGRLAAAGVSVLLIEAGPDYGPHGGWWPEDLLAAASLPTSHDWGFQGAGAGGQALDHDRARVIGGCSAHNGCTQSVGWAGDYDAWAPAGPSGWTADELGGTFAKAAEAMSVRAYLDEEVQPFHRAFLAGCSPLGMAVDHDFLDLRAGEGAGCPPVNIVDGVRINSAFAYLDPVRGLPHLRILAEAHVSRLLIRNGRATGVELLHQGELHTVSAVEVVLAAGAYGSPAILQRSGVGDVDVLSELGVEPVHRLLGVGRNLHDHPAVQLEFAGSARLTDELQGFARSHWVPEEQSVAKLRSPESDGPYDLHIYPWVAPPEGEARQWRCVIPVGLLTPRSRGQLRITSAAPLDPPIIDPGYFSDLEGADLRAIRFGVRWANDLVQSAQLRPLLGAMTSGLEASATDNEVDRWTRDAHAHYWHPAGTCRMGEPTNPAAVVDRSGRVHGLDALRVADASIFPAIPRATPALPTVVVGERVAHFMIEERRGRGPEGSVKASITPT